MNLNTTTLLRVHHILRMLVLVFDIIIIISLNTYRIHIAIAENPKKYKMSG